MRVLLIEDEHEYADELVGEMSDKYIIDVAYSGVEGTYLSQVNDYDAIVVDAVLPDMDGYDVCKETRSAEIDSPILFMSEDPSLDAMLNSLDSGADAYISKPVNNLELDVKLRALMRRKSGSRSSNIMKFESAEVDMKKRNVEIFNQRVPLRRKEYELFEYLMLNKDRAVSKEELLEHIWEDGINIFSNTVEVHMKNLRDKVEKPFKLKLIHTVRGFGYRLGP